MKESVVYIEIDRALIFYNAAQGINSCCLPVCFLHIHQRGNRIAQDRAKMVIVQNIVQRSQIPEKGEGVVGPRDQKDQIFIGGPPPAIGKYREQPDLIQGSLCRDTDWTKYSLIAK